MTESPRTVFKYGVLCSLTHLRISYRYERKHDKRTGKHSHGNVEHEVYIAYGSVFSNCTYQGAHQHRCQRSGKRVERSSDKVELVATVAASAKEVEHGVNHCVEHTYRETAYECTQKIHPESGKTCREARQILHEHTHKTNCNGHHCSLFITYLDKQLAGRYTHKQVCKEVHHVSHHA